MSLCKVIYIFVCHASIHGCLGVEIAPPFYGLDRPSLDYELPPLQYSVDELEPYIDENSVRVHYFGYHAKYVEEMNSILKSWRRSTLKGKHASRMSIIEILRNISHVPTKYRTLLKNYGSGFLNHNLYWATLSPNPQGDHRIPTGQMAQEVASKFGSFMEFKSTFTDMANNVFGSGYVWLCRKITPSEKFGELVITVTEKEDSPISHGLFPLLGIDMWEHAYLLKVHEQRHKYIENWWFIVDWKRVNELDDWWTRMKLHDEL